LALAQHVRHFAIGLGNPTKRVHHQHDHIRFLNSHFHLGADFINKRRRANRKGCLIALFAGVNTARINHEKIISRPVTFRHQAIARGARHVINDGEALLYQAIEKGTFTHVWSSDEHNDRFIHEKSYLFVHYSIS